MNKRKDKPRDGINLIALALAILICLAVNRCSVNQTMKNQKADKVLLEGEEELNRIINKWKTNY